MCVPNPCSEMYEENLRINLNIEDSCIDFDISYNNTVHKKHDNFNNMGDRNQLTFNSHQGQRSYMSTSKLRHKVLFSLKVATESFTLNCCIIMILEALTHKCSIVYHICGTQNFFSDFDYDSYAQKPEIIHTIRIKFFF